MTLLPELIHEEVRDVARPGIDLEVAGVARGVEGLDDRIESHDGLDVIGQRRSDDDRAGGRKGDEHQAL